LAPGTSYTTTATYTTVANDLLTPQLADSIFALLSVEDCRQVRSLIITPSVNNGNAYLQTAITATTISVSDTPPGTTAAANVVLTVTGTTNVTSITIAGVTTAGNVATYTVGALALNGTNTQTLAFTASSVPATLTLTVASATYNSNTNSSSTYVS